MEVVKNISDIGNYPILASKTFLYSFSGVDEVGYFVENEMFLPYVIRKKYFLRWMFFVTEVVGAKSKEEEEQFLNHLALFIKQKMRVSHAITTNMSVFLSYPVASLHCKWGTYQVQLSLSENELFSNLHSKHRNVIRKAEKDGIVVMNGKQYQNEVIDLMNATIARQKSFSSFNDDFLDRLNQMGENVDYWIAKDSNGVPQGSAIFLWNKGNSCYYLHGGSAQQTSSGSMNYLIWKAMLSMKERGVKVFDFVGARITTEKGSKLEGIQKFKSRFGSELKLGFSFVIIVNRLWFLLYNLTMFIAFALKGKLYKGNNVEQEIRKGNV